MRIITGKARGLKLITPKDYNVRPTADRVKESLFNILAGKFCAGRVLDAFAGKEKLTVSELEKKTGLRNVVPTLSSLLSYGAIEVQEEMKRGFAPKMETFVRLAEAYRTDEALQEAFLLLKRARKQEMMLVCYLDLSHVLNPALAAELSKNELIEQSGYSVSVLDGLVKRGILEYYEKEVGRLQVSVCRIQPPLPLSSDQERAYSEIHESFKTTKRGTKIKSN